MSVEEEYRYLTYGELGKGGMGTVWEVHDTSLNRRIAFKQMHPRFIGIKSMENRFLNEARILARLEHPGVVPIHELDVSSEDGAAYYTMDKVRGESLQSILDGLKKHNKATLHRWPLVRLVSAFSHLCETVAFAHEQGILHRDLKPDNVMLGRYGEVFLVDWGIAHIIGEQDSIEDKESIRIQETRLSDGQTTLITQANNVFGTPQYMSPESARGIETYTDGGSDIFALGAILYQILTLGPPYQGENAEEILSAAKAGKVRPVEKSGGLRTHLPNQRIPNSLASIAMMALSEDRLDRYATVQDMRRDVEAYLQGRMTSAQESGPFQMLRFFVRRNPALTLIATMAVLVVIGILFFGLKVNYQNRIEAEKARDLAIEKKEAFLAAKSASKADQNEAAPMFAQLAWERLQLCDIERAEDLAIAALEFKGGAEASAQAHLVLGLVKIMQRRPDQAAIHWDQAGEEPLLTDLKKLKEKEPTVSWSNIFEKCGLFALSIKLLEDDPESQFKQIRKFLSKRWNADLWEFSNVETKRSGFYRLDLKKGILPEDLQFLRGFPIRHLVLNDVPIADLGMLSDLPYLSILELGSGHLVKDLSPLIELKKLRSLSVAPLQMAPDHGFDLAPLAGLSQLETLHLQTNVLSLNPLRDLRLTSLRLNKLIRNPSLVPLEGMPLKSLEVDNLKNLGVLSGMPLENFRPGFRATGYSKREMEILKKLPLKEIRFEGVFEDEFRYLARLKNLKKLETNHLHNIRIWSSTSLASIHLKGSDHDFSGVSRTSITHLELSLNGGDSHKLRPVFYPLLPAIQIRKVIIDESELNEQPNFHFHLETPALTELLILEKWEDAREEFSRLSRRYQRHTAFKAISEKWLPVLENDIIAAGNGRANHTWRPALSFGGHLYQWFKTPMNWQAAKLTAKKLGGHLVSIDSEEEWKFLESKFGIPLVDDSVWSGGSNRIWVESSIPVASQPADPTRKGEAASIFGLQGNLTLQRTSPASMWSFIIEWDRNQKEEMPAGSEGLSGGEGEP